MIRCTTMVAVIASIGVVLAITVDSYFGFGLALALTLGAIWGCHLYDGGKQWP